MVRVNLVYHPAQRERWLPFLELRDLLADLDVELVDHGDTPVDLTLIHSNLLREKEASEGKPVTAPMVVSEWTDQETVTPAHRSLIKRSNVRAWIKECCFRDTSLYNVPLVNGNYHFSLLERDVEKYPAVVPQILLTAEDIQKIYLPFSVASYHRFDRLRRRQNTEIKDRDIDVLQYGLTAYPSEILSTHRRAGAREVSKLKQSRIVLATGGVIAGPELDNLLYRSKIVVSPYGHCMSSWKDWEALYSGCVLIKPDSEQQKNYLPDLFKGNAWYVPCSNDFSDLADKVDQVLAEYPFYYDKARTAKEALQESADLERRAADFYHFLMRTLNREPNSNFVPYTPIEPSSFVSTESSLRLPEERSTDSISRAPRAGPNLFGASDLSAPGWTFARSKISAEPIFAPSGIRAWKMAEDTVSGTHDFRRHILKEEASLTYTASFFAKPAERCDVQVWLNGSSHENRACAELDLGAGIVRSVRAVGQGWSQVAANIVNLEEGWCWCWISGSSDRSNRIGLLVSMMNLKREIGYVGDGKSGMWFGGVRIEDGPAPTLVFEGFKSR